MFTKQIWIAPSRYSEEGKWKGNAIYILSGHPLVCSIREASWLGKNFCHFVFDIALVNPVRIH